ncbi:MAG TPA: phosphoribosylanthranilate isomerase [Burkholderiaceae bacterium]
MRTRIKFCGMVRPVDVDAAVALGVDAVGFVFYPPSPRCIDRAEARRLRERLPSFVAAVGLFVDAAAATVRETVAEVGLDVVQFHGNESPAQCATAAGGVPFWRAVRVRARGDLLESASSYSGAEALLADSFSEGYGGSGKAFEWTWVPAPHERRLPLIMSGGLDAGSVTEAIARVAPTGVDVSSGIQGSDPRTKEWAKMERFVAAVIGADATKAGRGPDTGQ